MKKSLQLLALACIVILTSCGADDSTPNTSLAGENGFEFNKKAYITDIIYITPENNLILSSKELNGNTESVDIALFATKNGELSESTFGVGNSLTHCTAVNNGDWIESNIENGTEILGETIVSDGFLRILDYDQLGQTINILFEFQRKDGKLVAGQYEGQFERLAE